jgi:signal transduction histidine kinase
MKHIYGPLTDEQVDVLDVLQSSNRSCLSLVNGLLEVYRYDSGAAPLVLESFNLWLLLEETVGELQSLAREKELTLTLHAEPEDLLYEPDPHALVYADRMEIKRVLHNLISNAITNTTLLGAVDCRLINPHRTGKTTVAKVSEFRNSTLKTPLRTDGRLLVTIRDSGVGFTNEDLPNLFKRFAAGRGRHPMSLGLGLYNCYQVVQAHNGVLWVESTEGEGSAVNFLLPCTQTVAQDRRIRNERRRSGY